MKKNSLGILAGLCVLLTGCGGTKFVNELNEQDNTHTIKKTETLALKGFEDGAGDFTYTRKSNEEYLDGHFKGFIGIGSINGEVKLNETIKEIGTWTAGDNGWYTLKIYKLEIKCTVSGDGANEYKNEKLKGEYKYYGDEAVTTILDGDKYVKEYSDPLTRYAKVDTTNNTFTVTWAL